MKVEKRIIEFWKDHTGKIFKITHNPCGCHPLNVLKETNIDKRSTKNMRFKNAVSFTIRSRISYTKLLISNGCKRMSRKIET